MASEIRKLAKKMKGIREQAVPPTPKVKNISRDRNVPPRGRKGVSI